MSPERVELSKKTGLAHLAHVARRALTRNRRDAVIIVLTAVVGLAVTAWILLNQTQFQKPTWWPGTEERREFVVEFEDASGLLPGTAQPVAVAGVQVGVVKDVEVDDQAAAVTVEVEDEGLEVYEDATLIVRPRTALKDMFVALDPGTPAAGELENGGRIPIAQTQPTVDVQEILGNLDGNTRAYLRVLLSVGAQGLGGTNDNSDEGKPGQAEIDDLSSTLRTFEPFTSNARRAVVQLGKRRRNLKRVVTSLSQVMTSVGAVNADIAALIDGANRTFAATGSQNRQLAAALDELPPTLAELNTALIGAQGFSTQLRLATGNLNGFARSLAPAERALRPFARQTLPVLRDQLRPFSRETKPIIAKLKRPLTQFAAASPGLVKTTGLLDGYFNALGNNPPGSEEGYLFWGAWLAHIVPSLANMQDAHGAILRGLPMLTCAQIQALDTVNAANPILATIIKIANLPRFEDLC